MSARVAIVDYGMGNIFSVKRACEQVGLQGFLTSNSREIVSAEAVILPGVGAFGDAMVALKKKDLVFPIKEVVARKIPFMGICLGMQLLMTDSCEFGLHQGLDIVPGHTLRLGNGLQNGHCVKVPQVGWNRLEAPSQTAMEKSLLKGLSDGEYMYFVHSYYVEPKEASLVLTTTRYGDSSFCSSLQFDNVFACQFHPERSGPKGLKIYSNFFCCINHKEFADDR